MRAAISKNLVRSLGGFITEVSLMEGLEVEHLDVVGHCLRSPGISGGHTNIGRSTTVSALGGICRYCIGWRRWRGQHLYLELLHGGRGRFFFEVCIY